MTDAWPALDGVLAALRTAPPRTGSIIATVYGDAILPRGGSLSMPDLLTLMRRLGTTDGVVRTAVSRLAADGLLHGSRAGRHSAYALTDRGRTEFLAAIPRIYGSSETIWDGHLALAFPEPGTDRTALEAAGFALLAPGVLIAACDAPGGMPSLSATGTPDTMRLLAARAWPLARLRDLYTGFTATFAALEPVPDIAGLDAMAARTILIHAWRRIALRDPRLPPALLPPDWPGQAARELCVRLYAALAPTSERWLGEATGLAGKLPAGSDPVERFRSRQRQHPAPPTRGAAPDPDQRRR